MYSRKEKEEKTLDGNNDSLLLRFRADTQQVEGFILFLRGNLLGMEFFLGEQNFSHATRSRDLDFTVTCRGSRL